MAEPSSPDFVCTREIFLSHFQEELLLRYLIYYQPTSQTPTSFLPVFAVREYMGDLKLFITFNTIKALKISLYKIF